VLDFDLARFLLKPLGCALLAGAVLLALDDMSPLLRLAAGLATYGIAATAMRLVPGEERRFLREAARHGLGKRTQPRSLPPGD
jgi:hypothetical protein